MPLIAEVGSSVITIDEFLNLSIGDYIELDKKITEPILLKVGGSPKFTVQPGKKNNRLAVQILESIKEGEADE